MPDCRVTHRALARPRCVFVLPTSIKRIMPPRLRGSAQNSNPLEENYLSSVTSPPVIRSKCPLIRAQQQRAVFPERFRAATDLAVADADDDGRGPRIEQLASHSSATAPRGLELTRA